MPYNPWGLKELNTTEAAEHTHTRTHKEVKSIILRTGIRIHLREETVCVCVYKREKMIR